MNVANIEQTEHRTSNVQRRTSNSDVAPLRHLILFVYYLCFFSVLRFLHNIILYYSHQIHEQSFSQHICLFFIFSHSKFDVGRSMFDVHPFSLRPAGNLPAVSYPAHLRPHRHFSLKIRSGASFSGYFPAVRRC